MKAFKPFSIYEALWRGSRAKVQRLPTRPRLFSTSPPSSRLLHHQARPVRLRDVSQSLSPLRAQIRRNIRNRNYSSKQAPNPTPNPTSELGSPDSTLSLSQRLRKLSREYGWSALGVYLLLSALDFPFCFLAVRLIGTERIGHWEHVIVEGVRDTILYPLSILIGKENAVQNQEAIAMPAQGAGKNETATPTAQQKPHEWNWGVDEASEANEKEATIWTQLALAYAVHKSFIFLRVPLTAAVTPKVVKTLRGWGWNIGKRRPKPT